MTKNKALFVLNIIIFVILIVCLVFNASILKDMLEIKHELATNPDAGAIGLGLAVLLVLQIYLLIPYAVCLIISIVSMCKKYFNWLSIANAIMCGVAIVLTLVVMFTIGGNG